MFFPVIISSFIESFNPCHLTVLVFFLFFLFVCNYNRLQLLLAGGGFIAAMFVFSFYLSFGWLADFRSLEIYFVLGKSIALFLGLLAVGIGVFSFYDWWGCVTMKSPQRFLIKMPRFFPEELTVNHVFGADIFRHLGLLLMAVFLGLVAVLFQPASRDQVFLPVWSELIAGPGLRDQAVFFSGLYNFIFVLPFILSFHFLRAGLKSDKVVEYLKGHLSKVKIVHSAVFFGVGVGLLYMLSGS